MDLKTTTTTYHFDSHDFGATQSIDITCEGERIIEILISKGVLLSDLKTAVDQIARNGEHEP